MWVDFSYVGRATNVFIVRVAIFGWKTEEAGRDEAKLGHDEVPLDVPKLKLPERDIK